MNKDTTPTITLHPVKSSQVQSIGFDEATGTLAVKFTRGAGATYHYPGVTKETFEKFRAADSIGTFFGKHIKPLPFKKIAAIPA